jgi:hypothetical protein
MKHPQNKFLSRFCARTVFTALFFMQSVFAANALQRLALKDSSRVYVQGELQDLAKSRTITLQGEMTFRGTSIFGQYHYDGNIGVLRLEGRIDADNTVRIEEKASTGEFNENPNAKEKIYAIISGKLNREEGIIAGSWTSADGKTSYPCKFRIVAQFHETKLGKFDVSVRYPLFYEEDKYGTLNATLKKYMAHTLGNNASMLNEIEKEMQKNAPNGTKPDLPYDLTKTDELNIFHLSPRFLSAYHVESSFTGGAHFNYYYFGETWWNAGGKAWRKIAMKELFTADTAYIQRLNTLIVAKLKQQGAQFVVDGTITDFTDLLRRGRLAWVMRPAGITFIFAPLSVATFADGEFAAFVSWKAVKEFVRKDGPAGEFIR